MRKAVFLDRDGVINFDRKEYTWMSVDFELLPGVLEGCWRLQDAGYDLIVVTNQGGIAKGLYQNEDVILLHKYMVDLFKKSKIQLLEVYFCPHHPDYGKCLCRKPGSLLVEKALSRFQIDPTSSFFIGDMDRDIKAAHQAGVKGIKVETNSDFMNVINTIL